MLLRQKGTIGTHKTHEVKGGDKMAIKRVCERCGDISNSHKVYFGRYVATNILPSRSVHWLRKKKYVCFECYKEFENWLRKNKNFS